MSRRDFLVAAGAAGVAAACAPRARTVAGNAAGGADTAGQLVYVGTYTAPGRAEGVYAFRVDPRTNVWRPLGAFDVGPNPSFLAAHPRGGVLYAVNEVEQFGGAASGAVRALAIGQGGALTPLGTPRVTGGGAPCYVAADSAARTLLAANYAGGSVARFPLGADGAPGEAAAVHQHQGSGPRTDRQTRPHAHSVLPDPTGRWALAADLGTDQLFVYALDRPGLDPASVVAMRPGSGPRHLAFAPGGRVAYVAGELDRTVTTLGFDPATGALSPRQTVALADEATAPAGDRTAADLHVAPSGRFVYASVRGDDVLVVLAADPATGALAVVQRVPSGGRWPRNFALDPAGRMLYAANQRSNAIVAFAVDAVSGRLTPTGLDVAVPSPVCVCFARG